MNNKKVITWIRKKCQNTEIEYHLTDTARVAVDKFSTALGQILNEAENRFCKPGGEKMVKKKKSLHPKVWTKDEERKLLQYKKTMTNKEVAKKLGRTVKAVDNKVTQINKRKK